MNKLVLFDIDGTLIANARGHDEAFAIAFKAVYGVDASIHMINPNGMTDQEIIIAVMELCGVTRDVIEARITGCMDEMVRYFMAVQPYLSLKLLPGVKELLQLLKDDGCLMGLVTGNLEAIAWGKMETAGIREYFQLGGFGSDARNRSELVVKAISTARNKFNLSEAAGVYSVGDAPQDICAALAGGSHPFGVTTGVYVADELKRAGAVHVFNNLTELTQNWSQLS